MAYYEYKYRRRTADLKPWAICFVIVLLTLLVHCCTGQEEEVFAKEEAQVSMLDEAARVEVLSRHGEFLVEQEYQIWKGRK